jgi:hypothetical protein
MESGMLDRGVSLIGNEDVKRRRRYRKEMMVWETKHDAGRQADKWVGTSGLHRSDSNCSYFKVKQLLAGSFTAYMHLISYALH